MNCKTNTAIATISYHPACPPWCVDHRDQAANALTEPARLHHGERRTVVAVDPDSSAITETIGAELFRVDWHGRAGQPQVLVSRLDAGVRTDLFRLPLSIYDASQLAAMLLTLVVEGTR